MSVSVTTVAGARAAVRPRAMEPSQRSLGLIGIVLVIGFASAKDSDACSCVGSARLERTAEVSDAVLIARVVSPNVKQGAEYIWVQVLESLNGPAKGLRVRVWDSGWGTTCSAALSQFRTGAIVALALDRKKQANRNDQALQGHIETGAFLMATCGEHARVIPSLEEGQRLLAQLTKGEKAGKQMRPRKSRSIM